jgi:hypothetical protein
MSDLWKHQSLHLHVSSWVCAVGSLDRNVYTHRPGHVNVYTYRPGHVNVYTHGPGHVNVYTHRPGHVNVYTPRTMRCFTVYMHRPKYVRLNVRPQYVFECCFRDHARTCLCTGIHT